MVKRLPALLIISLIWFLHACEHEPIVPELPIPADTTYVPEDTVWAEPPTNACDSNVVYFENTILKLLVSKCGPYGYKPPTQSYFTCHGQEPYTEGVNLTTYEGIIKHVDTKDPLKSDIIEHIDATKIDDHMPLGDRGGKVTPAERQLIIDWMAQGAQNNRCNPCMEPDSVSFINDIAPMLFDNCRGCHNDENNKDKVYITFFDSKPTAVDAIRYEDVRDNAKKFLIRMSSNQDEPRMPKTLPKMYQCEFDLLRRWVEAGSPNN